MKEVSISDETCQKLLQMAKIHGSVANKTNEELADLVDLLKGDKNMTGPEYAILEIVEERLRGEG